MTIDAPREPISSRMHWRRHGEHHEGLLHLPVRRIYLRSDNSIQDHRDAFIGAFESESGQKNCCCSARRRRSNNSFMLLMPLPRHKQPNTVVAWRWRHRQLRLWQQQWGRPIRNSFLLFMPLPWHGSSGINNRKLLVCVRQQGQRRRPTRNSSFLLFMPPPQPNNSCSAVAAA